MIQNVNPQQQQFYVPQNMPPYAQDYQPQYQAPAYAPGPALPPGVMPVYNNIPYNPVYGNQGQAQQCRQPQFAPKISTVSIELNGLEAPKVPGLSDFGGQPAPVYPGMTQMPVQSYPGYPQQYAQQQAIPQQIGADPVPAAIPPAATVGAMPPPPQYVQQAPKQEPVIPPAAVDQAQKSTVAPVNQQQDQESVKPLLDALNVICTKQGAPESTVDAQGKAVLTVAQFARVAAAANELILKDPNNADVKQTKEKVDNLIKPNLIKEETFLGLTDLAVKDTSKLTGEDKKKADENRVISMFTLAMLQKYFKQEMNDEAKKINIPPISMNEVPGIVQVVDLVQNDANPDIREAGIAALVNLANPADPKDVETMRAVLGESQNDKAETVKKAAADAIKLYPEPAKTEKK